MKKFKFNSAKMKEFLFLHVEKIVLGVCVFLALFLGTLGMIRAMGAGKDKSGLTFVEAIKKQTEKISAGIRSAVPKPLPRDTEAKLDSKFYDWKYWESKFGPSLYLSVPDSSNDKRDNPRALAIKSGLKNIQLDYLRTLVLTYDYDPALRTMKGLAAPEVGGGVGGIMKKEPVAVGKKKEMTGKTDLPPFLRAGQPRRMVVCSAVFPMKQQVEEFRRKLRMKTQKELLASKDDLPTPLGIQVIRFEVLPNGDTGKGEDLIKFDLQDGKVQTKLSEPLKRLLREAIYDDKAPEKLEPYLWHGLAMPMPLLAYGAYPKITLDGIEVEFDSAESSTKPKEVGGMIMPKKKEGTGVVVPGKGGLPNPMGKQPGNNQNQPVPDGKPVPITLKELKTANPALADRLFSEKFDAFHALGGRGQSQSVKGKGGKQPAQPTSQPKGESGSSRFLSAWDVKPSTKGDEKPEPEGKGPMVESTDWDRDALVHFIDPDVEPGKTYKYAIQVRLKNPNFNKKEDVAFQQLASIEELPLDPISSWTQTPTITIPYEYSLYAVDQHLLDDWATEKKSLPTETKKDYTTFQVHQWIKKKFNFASDDEYVIGDWVIAERLYVRKGDPIGGESVVQVPVWRKFKNDFEVPHAVVLKHPTNPKAGAVLRPGIKIDLAPAGNEGDNARPGTPPVLVDFFGGKHRLGNVIEEAAVDALVMSSDGRLIVINSREDSDSANSAARERQERVLNARNRVDEVLGLTDNTNGPGGTK